MMNSAPILSIGMIVKNEARCLERCMKALEPLRQAIPCELVVADTGSDDGTREIASQYADILFDFAWIKDFSAARNAVMDRCSGKWFLSLDADEYLDPDIQQLVAFLTSKDRDTYTSAYYVIRNYSDPDDLSQYSSFHAQRMLNMSTGLRFEGRIHEAWPDQSRNSNILLVKTIFWHDGYIHFTNVAESKKSARNLELIELELQEDPDNLLRVYQAQESAVDQKKREDYVRRMIQMVEAGNPCSDSMGPVCYRSAVQVARQYGMPELDDWIESAYQKYPDSPYVQIDVKYVEMMRAVEHQNHEQTIACASAYLKNAEKLEQNGYDASGLLTGPLLSAKKVHMETAYLSIANAYAYQKKWADCGAVLREHPPMDLSLLIVKNWCNLAYLVWEHVDLSPTFEQIGKELYSDRELEDPLAVKRRDAITKRSLELFHYIPALYQSGEEEMCYPSAPAYPLLVALGDGVLCPAAQIMLATDCDSAAAAAAQVKDWNNLPVQPVEQLLGYRLQLPAKFYEIGFSKLERIAGGIATHLKTHTPKIVLEWLKRVPECRGCALDRVWRYNLIIASIRVSPWHDAGEPIDLSDLLDLFYQMSEQYLGWYYQAQLLQKETIAVLPDMHQFAWYFVQYYHAVQRKDWSAAVSCLHSMLSCAPVMKGMVDFLLQQMEERKQQESASPELLELAEKVRTILARYSPYDPAVTALKQSEVYQKVA